MGSLSIWHWIVVVIVVLLLFGRGKISELMGDMAQGIKAFKKGMQDEPEVATAKPVVTEPVRTIGSPVTTTAPASAGTAAATNPALAKRADTETRVEGSTL